MIKNFWLENEYKNIFLISTIFLEKNFKYFAKFFKFFFRFFLKNALKKIMQQN